MKNIILGTIAIVAAALIGLGCMGGEVPVVPDGSPSRLSDYGNEPGRMLWGLWRCTMAPGSGRIDVVEARTCDLTMNVNVLLNAKPGSLQIGDIDTTHFLSEGRLDCTVTLTHPLGGQDRFSGFDVWGVFLHNGASALNYQGLTYSGGSSAGSNEAMLLNADGYTRWFNQLEFDGDGPDLFEYFPGKPSNLPMPTAELNGYRIFADGLGAEVDYHDWISSPVYPGNRGIFRSGASNSRRYHLGFPIIGGAPKVDFQFAVVASWAKGDPTLTGNPKLYEPWDFPPEANVDEPFFVDTSTVASTLFFDPGGTTVAGGDFIAEVEVFDWQGGTVAHQGVPNEIERLVIEGDFLPDGSVEYGQSELGAMASEGTSNSSVFTVEIGDCSPLTSGQTEFWMVTESAGESGDSYDQGFGSAYPAGSRRAAFYRGSVAVSPQAPFVNTPPEITGIEDDIAGPGAYKNPVTTDDKSVTYTVIFTDPDIGQDHTITWWITADGATPGPGDLVAMPVDWSTYAVGEFDIYVEVNDGYDAVLGGPFDITLEEGTAPKWGDPVNIDYSSEMPRAVVNAAGEIVLIYYRNDDSVMYAVNDGTWHTPELARKFDSVPGFMHIVAADPSEGVHTVYAGLEGTAEEAAEDCHALRWQGAAGEWDYMSCHTTSDLPSIFVPDDDGTFTHVFITTTLNSVTRFESWGGLPGGVTTVPGDEECTYSCAGFAERNSDYHLLVYGCFDSVLGVYRVKVLGVPKSDDIPMGFVIPIANLGDTIATPGLCMDTLGVLHAAWKMNDAGAGRIEYSRSTDGGLSWSAPVTVFTTDYETSLLGSYIGIDSDQNDRVYITYALEPYVYMVYSDDGIGWSEPSSPYEGPLPLGYHWTEPYPVVTPDGTLYVFYALKNEGFNVSSVNVVTWE